LPYPNFLSISLRHEANHLVLEIHPLIYTSLINGQRYRGYFVYQQKIFVQCRFGNPKVIVVILRQDGKHSTIDTCSFGQLLIGGGGYSRIYSAHLVILLAISPKIR